MLVHLSLSLSPPSSHLNPCTLVPSLSPLLSSPCLEEVVLISLQFSLLLLLAAMLNSSPWPVTMDRYLHLH